MGLLGGNNSQPVTRYNGIRTSEAILGTPLPIIVGQQRLSWKLLWYGDFHSSKAKQQGGGSGASKGGTQYVYTASVIGSVCMGPCQNFLGVWDSIGRFATDTYIETTNVSAGSFPTYTPTHASIFHQDLGAGMAQAYSVTVNDYGSPGSITYSGTQQAPLAYTSSTTPGAGQYTVNTTSGVYTFNSAQTGTLVTVTYVAFRYQILESELDVVPNSPPYQVTVQYQSSFKADAGVTYYPSGIALTAVNGTPSVTGTYWANGGNYRFAPGDVGLSVTISYEYNDPNTDTNAPSTLNLTFFGGNLGQAPWSYMTSKFPGDTLGYSEVAYIASSGLYLGFSPVLPQYNFEILGPYSFGNGISDANPADAIYGLLTNTAYKLNFPLANIDTTSLLTSNSSVKTMWSTNNFFISAILDSQDSLMSILGNWCEAGQAFITWDEGLLKFIPLVDTTSIANGATYIPPTQPVVDLDDNDFVVDTNKDPIEVTQQPWQNRWNRVQVRWSVRSNDYNEDILQIQDEASVQQYGLIAESAQDYQFICTEPAAQFAANMRLQRYSAIYTTYNFTLKSNFAFLSPGDIVTITDGLLGTSGTMFGRTPCRIIKMTDDPVKGIEIEAENFPWSVGASLLYNKQAQIPSNTNDGPQQDPGNTIAVIFEVPNRAQMFQGGNIFVFLNGQNVNWGGCQAWVSYNGTDYNFYGMFDTPGKIGVTTADFPLHADPDNVDTLTVNMQQSGATLISVTAADLAAFVTLSAVVSPGNTSSKTLTAGLGINVGTSTGSGTSGSQGPQIVQAGAAVANPGIIPGGGNPWSNPTNITGNVSFAQSSLIGIALRSNFLYGSNVGFTVPTTGIGPIIGLQVTFNAFVNGQSVGSQAHLTAQLVYQGAVLGSIVDVWAPGGFPTVSTPFTLGSLATLGTWFPQGFGGNLTSAVVNDPTFGIYFSNSEASGQNSVTNVNNVKFQIVWAAGGAATAWTNPNDVTGSVGYATSPLSSIPVTQWLTCTNFGFVIPFGFVLEGIEVTVNAYVSTGSCTLSAMLNIEGMRVGNIESLGINTTPTDYTFGSVSDFWGVPALWDLATLNDLTFGVSVMGAGVIGTSVFVNNVRITLVGTSVTNLELIAYETATLVGTNTYALTTLRRGVYGSYPVDHPLGSTFARLDQATFTYQVDPTFNGTTIYFKFLSFNAYGNQLQSLANVTPYLVPINGLAPGAIDLESGNLMTGLTATTNSSALMLESAVNAVHGSFGIQNIPAGYGLVGPNNTAAGTPIWQPIITGGGGAGGVANVFVIDISGSYSAQVWDYLVCNTSAGSFSVVMPKANASTNAIIGIQKNSTDANTVTITPAVGDTVQMQSTVTLGSFGDALLLVSDGTSNWVIIAGYSAAANDMYIFIPAISGIYGASQELYYAQPVRNFTMPSGLTNTNSGCRVAPTGNVAVGLLKNNVSIGTINFTAGSQVPTYTFSTAQTFNGTTDTFSIIAPASIDKTFAGFWADFFVIRGIGSALSGGGGGGGGGGGAAAPESTQSLSTSGTIGFLGALNTVVQATGGGAGITLTLPSAALVPGQIIRIVKIDAGAGLVTINTTGGQTINGASTFVISSQWEYANFEAISSNWVVTAWN